MRMKSDYYAEQVDHDIARELLLLDPGHSPTLALLMGRGLVAPSNTYDFHWLARGLPDRRTQIDNGDDDYDQDTTSIVVDSVAPFEVNGLVLCEATGEVILVTAINAGAKTLTISRGIGSGVAAAAGSVADDAYLRFIGIAMGEASSSPSAKARARTKYTNGIQTFRKPVEISGHAEREGLKTVDDLPAMREEAHLELLNDIEQAFIYGSYSNDSVGADGENVITVGGIATFVDFVDNVNGTMTIDRFEQFAERAFKYKRELVLEVGNLVSRTLHSLYRGSLVQREGNVAVGMMITAITTANGVFELLPNRSLQGADSGSALALDPTRMKLRHANGNGKVTTGLPHLRQGLEANDTDAKKVEWWAEVGIELGAPENHSILKGVTGPA